MGLADFFATVVRDNEAKKVFGTPYYADELKKREIANQLAQLGLQQKQFEVEHQPESFAADIESKRANAGLKGATVGLTEAKTTDLENRNNPDKLAQEAELRDITTKLKQAQLEASTAKTPMEKELIQAKIADLHDRMAKRVMGGGGASKAKPAEKFVLKRNDKGELVGISSSDPLHQVPTGFKDKPAVAQQERDAQMNQLNDALATMEKTADGLDEGMLAPITGRISKAKQSVFPEGPAADFDYAGKRALNLVYLLSGKAITEKERAMGESMIPNRAKGNLPKQIEMFKQYLNSLMPSNASTEGTKSGSSKYKVEVVE